MIHLEDIAESILQGKPLLPLLKDSSENGIFNALSDLGMADIEIQAVLEELLLNAREHGQNKNIMIYMGCHVGWFFAVIRDQGPGIHMTLPKNPRLADTKGKSAAALIRLAVEEGITGTGTVGRGIGLHILSELVSSRRAESLVISDGGLFVQVGDVFLERYARIPTDGTLVAIKVEIQK
ncbi:MAG: hypothetical protein AABZ06_05725 [Bdellovibrionota bacterium]